jgi:hypothetical protein
MKRTILPYLLVLASLALPSSTLAQAASYQPIRFDITFYGGYAPADAAAYGGGLVLEPKYNLLDQLAIGLRLEGGAFATQTVKTSAAAGQAEVSQSARAITAYLVKADWYLTTSSVRPFVGLGAGLYRIASGSQSVSGSGASTAVVQRAESFQGFGVAPQVGVNFGGFRLAATYHMITGDDQVVVTQAIGTTPTETKLSKNYFAFEIGGTIGGNRRAGP